MTPPFKKQFERTSNLFKYARDARVVLVTYVTDLERRTRDRRDAFVWATAVMVLAVLFASGLVGFV